MVKRREKTYQTVKKGSRFSIKIMNTVSIPMHEGEYYTKQKQHLRCALYDLSADAYRHLEYAY